MRLHSSTASIGAANVAATTPRARQPFISKSVDRAKANLAEAERHLRACRLAYVAALEHEREWIVEELTERRAA